MLDCAFTTSLYQSVTDLNHYIIIILCIIKKIRRPLEHLLKTSEEIDYSIIRMKRIKNNNI